MEIENLPDDDVDMAIVFTVVEGLVEPARGRGYTWRLYRPKDVKCIVLCLTSTVELVSARQAIAESELRNSRSVYDLIDFRFRIARRQLWEALAG